MLGKNRIASIVDITARIWKDPARYVEKYKMLYEAQSQAMKIAQFFRIYRSEKKFEAIMI